LWFASCYEGIFGQVSELYPLALQEGSAKRNPGTYSICTGQENLGQSASGAPGILDRFGVNTSPPRDRECSQINAKQKARPVKFLNLPVERICGLDMRHQITVCCRCYTVRLHGLERATQHFPYGIRASSWTSWHGGWKLPLLLRGAREPKENRILGRVESQEKKRLFLCRSRKAYLI
jgi:hypothetical protein